MLSKATDNLSKSGKKNKQKHAKKDSISSFSATKLQSANLPNTIEVNEVSLNASKIREHMSQSLFNGAISELRINESLEKSSSKKIFMSNRAISPKLGISVASIDLPSGSLGHRRSKGTLHQSSQLDHPSKP